MAAILITFGSMSVITALVVTLIRAQSRDHPGRFILLVLFLMCILVGLAACGEYPPADIPPGGGDGNPLPTPTISGPSPLRTGTPCVLGPCP